MVAVALLAGELLFIAWIYQFARPVDCAITASPRACALAGGLGLKFAAIVSLIALHASARAGVARALTRERRAPAAGFRCALAHAAGLGLILAPAFAPVLDPVRALPAALACWVLGGALAAGAAALWLASTGVWAAVIRAEPGMFAAILGAGFLLPGLVEALDVIWRIDGLAHLTLSGVVGLLRLAGAEVYLDEPAFLVGSGDFVVMIADGCSGVQGVVLITALISAWIFFDRTRLRFPAALLLIPLGIVLSLALNILRIAGLIAIGAGGAPDLAVNGFHSNAGWLLFTLLSFALIWLGRAAPVFRSERVRTVIAPPPILADPVAARIVPFVVMMLTGTAAAAFATLPDLWYPLRAGAIAAALVLFLPAYRVIDWRPDRLGLALGPLIGLAWVLTRAPADPGDMALVERLSRLSPENLLLWVTARLVATAILVPVVEELFFRDYLLGRTPTGRLRVFALIASSALFALLHDRWLAGFLSGLVFGLITLRAGRLGPAVAAHAGANATIAAFALAAGDWSVI
ncbi:exosortase E/protease, VPEID-CTERM system [Amaricoccus sp. W119]|uniref:exosortase E/protease, VPEID-CTERM system n=1 Tax=Amaricoccus sp. W119 TaxID=3391833 RepID=UPI0039A67DE4